MRVRTQSRYKEHPTKPRFSELVRTWYGDGIDLLLTSCDEKQGLKKANPQWGDWGKWGNWGKL